MIKAVIFAALASSSLGQGALRQAQLPPFKPAPILANNLVLWTAMDVKNELLKQLLKPIPVAMINQMPGDIRWNKTVQGQYDSGQWDAWAQDEADRRNVDAFTKAGRIQEAQALEARRMERLSALQKAADQQKNEDEIRRLKSQLYRQAAENDDLQNQLRQQQGEANDEHNRAWAQHAHPR